jgi:hypothetical protein
VRLNGMRMRQVRLKRGWNLKGSYLLKLTRSTNCNSLFLHWLSEPSWLKICRLCCALCIWHSSERLETRLFLSNLCASCVLCSSWMKVSSRLQMWWFPDLTWITQRGETHVVSDDSSVLSQHEGQLGLQSLTYAGFDVEVDCSWNDNVGCWNECRRVLTMQWISGVKLTTLDPEEIRSLVKVSRCPWHSCYPGVHFNYIIQ